jgi:regulatory protein
MGQRVITATRMRDDGLIAIELDGTAWLALDPLIASRLDLTVGATPDHSAIVAAEREAARTGALRRGARMAARRSHARGELERKLARAAGDDAARAATDRLVEIGAVDDARHARDVAAHRLDAGWGPARIAHDLATAGIADALIVQTIADLGQDAIEAAARLALGSRTGAEGWKRLAARGFDEDVAELLLGADEG